MPKRCPTCKQTINLATRVRYCGNCGQPMALHDKWTFQFKGKSVQMVHRHCDNPESYLSARQERSAR